MRLCQSCGLPLTEPRRRLLHRACADERTRQRNAQARAALDAERKATESDRAREVQTKRRARRLLESADARYVLQPTDFLSGYRAALMDILTGTQTWGTTKNEATTTTQSTG